MGIAIPKEITSISLPALFTHPPCHPGVVRRVGPRRWRLAVLFLLLQLAPGQLNHRKSWKTIGKLWENCDLNRRKMWILMGFKADLLAKLAHKTWLTIGFMRDITLVNRAYKPTDSWWGLIL